MSQSVWFEMPFVYSFQGCKLITVVDSSADGKLYWYKVHFNSKLYYKFLLQTILWRHIFLCIWFTCNSPGSQNSHLRTPTGPPFLNTLSDPPQGPPPTPANLPDDTQYIFQNLLNYHMIGQQNGWNEKTKNIKCLQGSRATKTLIYCWEYKLVQLLWKTVWRIY